MQQPANRYTSGEARQLLHFLEETAGRGILTGQHTQTREMEELAYIREVTGKRPKLIGFELLSYSPNINYGDASEPCLREIRENRGTLETAMQVAKTTDAVLTFTFHWFSPLGGRDKSFYAEHTDFDAAKVLVEGTEERRAFFRDMEYIGELLRPFARERLPVLWRPFHEAEGKWFWWGAKGPAVARELYRLMFRTYTQKLHLDNLLWVWNCPLAEGYPGDDCVDIISRDVYLEKPAATAYEREYRELIARTTDRKVAALAEVGILPDAKLLAQTRVPWAYYMTWSKEFCMGEACNKRTALKAMYDSEYAVTGK